MIDPDTQDYIDHFDTENITCPHCGHEDSASAEYQANNGDMSCLQCEQVFHYERNFEISYSTTPF